MAEYTYNPVQIVEPGQNVILNDNIPCNKGYVLHREESGIVILRGIVNCPNACFARYQVTSIITVPKGCCFTVAIENTSGPAAPGGVAPEILVQNANLTVSRIA